MPYVRSAFRAVLESQSVVHAGLKRRSIVTW